MRTCACSRGVEGLLGAEQRDADARILRRLSHDHVGTEVGVGVVGLHRDEGLAQVDPASGTIQFLEMSGKMAFETPSAMAMPVGAPPPSGTSAITADFSSFTSPDWIGISDLQESKGQAVEVGVGTGRDAQHRLGFDGRFRAGKATVNERPSAKVSRSGPWRCRPESRPRPQLLDRGPASPRPYRVRPPA